MHQQGSQTLHIVLTLDGCPGMPGGLAQELQGEPAAGALGAVAPSDQALVVADGGGLAVGAVELGRSGALEHRPPPRPAGGEGGQAEEQKRERLQEADPRGEEGPGFVGLADGHRVSAPSFAFRGVRAAGSGPARSRESSGRASSAAPSFATHNIGEHHRRAAVAS